MSGDSNTDDYGRRAYDHRQPDPKEAEPKPESSKHDEAGKNEGPERPAISPQTTRRLAWGGGLALVLAILFASFLFWHHHHQLKKEAERRRQEVARGPRIFVAQVRLTPGARELTLPADVRGFLQATVYAKVSGYVKTILVDKGDRVTEGQVLGVLESPEVDQQVAAAEADLIIKQRTFERYRLLVKKDYVSAQDFETARAQFQVSQANVKQAKAMQAYETLHAPYTGTVTARYVDRGALVPAATGSTQSALPLVDVADLRRLRILVFVQQDAAPYVHAGDTVRVAIDQQPNVRIEAPISRCADALDPRSRTMLCEIWVDNDHHLFPGTFVHVTLRLTTPQLPVISSSALIMRKDKPAVALVRGSKIHFASVRPGLDDGKTVQILDGLQAGDRVALSPPAELTEGALVQPVEQKSEAGGESKGGRDGGASDGGSDAAADGGAHG